MCPLCNSQAMSFVGKTSLGPARKIVCKNCGKKIGVAYSSLFAILPLALVLAYELTSGQPRWAVILVAFIFVSLYWVLFIPLKEK